MDYRHKFGLRRKTTGRTSTTCRRSPTATVLSNVQPELRKRNTLPSRVYGNAQRFYGKINLTVDPSIYLRPNNANEEFDKTKHCQNLSNGLVDLSRSRKGCLVLLTLEYFENSDDVRMYVDTLISLCLTSDYILDVTTKNFLLISSLVTFGESIKRTMFNSLNHIHNDLHTGLKNNSPQLLCKQYNPDITFSFIKLVGLLFFRFRKHLGTNERYKLLAPPVLCGLNYLLDEGSLDSLILFTRLVHVNFHSLEMWLPNGIMKLEYKIQMRREDFTFEEDEWHWLSGALNIIYLGPVLPKNVYNIYTQRLGNEWTENVDYPPVGVLDPVNDGIIKEKMDSFHININDVYRNMCVNLP